MFSIIVRYAFNGWKIANLRYIAALSMKAINALLKSMAELGKCEITMSITNN